MTVKSFKLLYLNSGVSSTEYHFDLGGVDLSWCKLDSKSLN